MPQESISVNFDNIKTFYHLTRPDRPPARNSRSFYIARPGASVNECIDWAAEGIDIEVSGPGRRWGKCRMLVQQDTRIRITLSWVSDVHAILFSPEMTPLSQLNFFPSQTEHMQSLSILGSSLDDCPVEQSHNVHARIRTQMPS